MRQDVSIRLATCDDINTVQNLARLIWAHTYAGVLPKKDQTRVLNQSYSRESLVRSIRENVFLLAEVSGLIAGYVDMGTQNEVLYLHRLYVSPELQRSGIGRRLLEEAIAESIGRFEKRGDVSLRPRVVVATVERDNPKARSFYGKMGFTEETVTSVNMGGVELPVIYIVKPLA